MGGYDQLRVLATDGPSMLAYVGAFRPEPFTARERRLLQRLAPALQRRLKIDRDLADSALNAAALTAALESVSSAAFVARADGAIAHANAAGSAMFHADSAATRERLRSAIAAKDPGASVTRLAARGLPPHALVVLRPDEASLTPRLAYFRARAGLTARQAEVLELLARGMANKSVAATLKCAPRTVEIHVSAILAKCGCESRAELTALFWSRA